MNTHGIRLLALLAPLALLAGCGHVLKWATSGIPQALNTEAIIQAAGAPQRIAISGHDSACSSEPHSYETMRRFHATISSGTRGQLLAAYRLSVKKTVEGGGAVIYGESRVGNEDDIQDFSYDYHWGGNDGLVRVYSFDGTNGEIQVISFCYEHRT